MDGVLHLVGTLQADKSEDYLWLIDQAQNDTEGIYYFQKGSMYDNVYLPKHAVEETERSLASASPELRQQVIYGEYVSTGEKYFDWTEIKNATDITLKLLSDGKGGQYICAVDFSAAEDYTVIMVVDYSQEPYKLVYHMRFKGKKVPIPMQYEMVKSVVRRFNAKLIIDSSALGGKNALSFLADCNPIPFNFTPMSKAEMLASLKIAFQGGQSLRFKRDVSTLSGVSIDRNPNWGLVRFPDIPELTKELLNYKLEDSNIINDQVMTLGMAIHWIELRRPKRSRSILEIDLLSPKYSY
jgi:hypothetical protein